MPKRLSNEEIERFADAYNKYGTIRAAAARLDLSVGKSTHKRYKRALAAGLIQRPGSDRARTREELKAVVDGHVREMAVTELELPPKGKVRRYILTCAQNNTRLHRVAWENLLALARHHDARVVVSRFIYDKRMQTQMDKDAIAPGRAHSSEITWEPELLPYLADDRVTLAPGLVWCGEMNILPTAVRPLSGMEAYTGRKSAIFPHVKLAMESVPSGKYEATKLIYTTGTVTQRNYIQRKAGLKADFHHCYGGLLVEVDSDGDWFVRQLNADGSGSIYDLDLRVSGGQVTSDHTPAAITWGDAHVSQIDPVVAKLAWNEGGMLDTLRPHHQFLHDVFSFRSRNHHDRRDHHMSFRRYVAGADDVVEELEQTGAFIQMIERPWCRTIVVESNHDNALGRWLRDEPGWYARDPQNALIFLRCQLMAYQAMKDETANFLLIEQALQRYGGLDADAARFLREDESFIICPDAGGGIECGMHGHLGPNGARGGANVFARMGRKANVGHSHQAGIRDGVYTAGTSSLLDLEYNRGPSSWSHSHVLTYANGKRAILTLWNNKWRA